MTATLKDLATHLNVSVTQVSRALGGYPDVSAETRTRVEQAARDLGYGPNYAARHLKQQRADMIGLVLPNLAAGIPDPFFAEMVAGVGSEAKQRGYDVLLSSAAPGPEEIASYERVSRGGPGDGDAGPMDRRGAA